MESTELPVKIQVHVYLMVITVEERNYIICDVKNVVDFSQELQKYVTRVYTG